MKEDLIALVGLFGVRLLLLGEFRLGLAAIAISIVTVAGALTILAVLIGGFPG